jgi:aminoglycoside phosphotransferase family enzyme
MTAGGRETADRGERACREIGIQEKVAFLQRPESYPDAARRVETIETHMAWVFLTDQHAWKLKKPVRTRLLDFSTPQRRREVCSLEVTLNRRLAPGVYLAVVPLTLDSASRLSLSGDGAAVDWLVQMRKLPRDRMLDAALTRSAATPADAMQVARTLTEFVTRSPPADISPEEHRQRFSESIREIRIDLADPAFDLPHPLAERRLDSQLAFLAHHGDMLDQRVHERRVIEGHGDLRPEHICLETPPVIIDCLEFDRRLRMMDFASELSFLSLECQRLGAGWFGESVLRAYCAATGDDPPSELLRFYRSWHACSRARIALLHLRDEDVRDGKKWIERARWYLARGGL